MFVAISTLPLVMRRVPMSVREKVDCAPPVGASANAGLTLYVKRCPQASVSLTPRVVHGRTPSPPAEQLAISTPAFAAVLANVATAGQGRRPFVTANPTSASVMR